MQDEHDQSTNSTYLGNTWHCLIVNNQTEPSTTQMVQFNTFNSTDQDRWFNTFEAPPANSVNGACSDELLEFLATFGSSNPQSGTVPSVPQVSSGITQLTPDQPHADLSNNLNTFSGDFLGLTESTRIQSVQQSTSEAWQMQPTDPVSSASSQNADPTLLPGQGLHPAYLYSEEMTSGLLTLQGDTNYSTFIGKPEHASYSEEVLQHLQAFLNLPIEPVNEADPFPLASQAPNNQPPEIPSHTTNSAVTILAPEDMNVTISCFTNSADSALLQSRRHFSLGSLPIDAEPTVDIAPGVSLEWLAQQPDALFPCTLASNSSDPLTSSQEVINKTATSTLATQASSSHPTSAQSYSSNSILANVVPHAMDIPISYRTDSGDVITPPNGQYFSQGYPLIDATMESCDLSLESTDIPMEWLSQQSNVLLSPTLSTSQESHQTILPTGDMEWESFQYTSLSSDPSTYDPLSSFWTTIHDSASTNDGMDSIVTNDALGSNLNPIDPFMESESTSIPPPHVQSETELTIPSPTQLDSNVDLQPQRSEAQDQTYAKEVRELMKPLGWFPEVGNTRIRDLVAATPPSRLPRDQHGYLSPIIIYTALLTDKDICVDFPRKLWSETQNPAERETGDIKCQFQATVYNRGQAAWVFHGSKCGHIAEDRRQYVEHLLGHHLGLGHFQSMDSTIAQSRRPHGIDPRSDAANAIRERLLEAIMYLRFANKPELTLNKPEHFFEGLARDKQGFLEPLLVYILLLCEVSTVSLVEIFPISQRPHFKYRYQIVGSVACFLNSHIPNRGEAKWMRLKGPCNLELSNANNYRRHLIERHFGIMRGKDSMDRRIWNRLLAALHSDNNRQK